MLEKVVLQKAVPVHPVSDPVLKNAGVTLSILRCDLIHPELSGNKWYKLKYNLLEAKEQGHTTLLSFGGAWSNHIHALAAAGKLYDFKTIGVIRGAWSNDRKDDKKDDRGQALTACLSDAVINGMELHWLSREDYRHKHEEKLIESLQDKFGNFFLIPEGGANLAGIRGCSEILTAGQVQDYDLICLACGTGTTLTGLVSVDCPPILGFQVLKGRAYLKQEVKSLLNQHNLVANNQWAINELYHFGGYAKTNSALMKFIDDFQRSTGIPIEPVYSGKTLFGLYDLVKQNYFHKNTRILMIHGGGLQGARGLKKYQQPDDGNQ